ncbi:uncharacterized protein B0H64DRAFT_452561 [Chaetomium fimeti]|uniref:Protein kinase domain-containing protein n=1 Tax=Chaetomium fimeti TaxID=1854472 RepID=A0AAE0H7S5_9PEZI|nr:hypothetical protein B0H64DRAFT_452561 [Chaetomium fimeti]
MDWEPPPDPEKPSCPYVVGFKMAVTPHTPPPPFGGANYRHPGARPADSYDKITAPGYTQTRYCVKDLKPDEAPSSAASTNPDPWLVIESVIRGGDKAGAQVVACHWDNDPSKTTYLAKIYDPLYYDFEGAEHRGIATDVVWDAERDYSVEAAAYEELKAYETRWAISATTMLQDESNNIKGCYPAYFGSFAFKPRVVVGGLAYTRTVPLILTEYLPGPSMEQMMAVKHVKTPGKRGFDTVIEVPGTDDARIHAFTRAAESYLKLVRAGVGQGDFAPRNIFLLGDLHSPTLRAVISDFNVARVFSRMSPPRTPPKMADPDSFCAAPGWEARFEHWLPGWFFTDEERRNSRLRIEFPNEEV